MAIILSFLTDFQNSFTAGKPDKFPTFSMLQHYLAKVKSMKLWEFPQKKTI